MKIIKLEVGNLGANCYIVYCEKTLNGAVIDPGGNAQDIIRVINQENIKIVSIINTHGHADHIGDNDRIKEHTGAPVMIHKEDAGMLISSQGNLSMYIGSNLICQAADVLLSDGQKIMVGELEFQVIHTPGHTPGGICLKVNDVVFSGDTLFQQSIGRSDFPGGSHNQLVNSIKERLLVLADETTILPGHGGETTIINERQNNPFLQ
ncbi:MBL fold metallo-hydrolase [Pelosinus sp. IPA-1]|uniref:MBL fold metallo-hydrolase n=1 Tax=Pelosinus sp. IPA-1 TaxID=3029569 RepID=UPI00243618D1|nr:MBL fold metallo-hydrolase [Pelosinus sp. IPA-1]GMB02092.1 MBL fold metallo-hydrolase [Pelosinus sp. IPA-1]